MLDPIFKNKSALRGLLIIRTIILALTAVANRAAQDNTPPPSAPKGYASDEIYYWNVHPYLELAWDKLRKQIPELNKVHPADDQSVLPEILAKTAATVDDFFLHIFDLIATEKIKQEKLSSAGLVIASERVEDNYLILRHSDELKADMVEYRMDAQGKRLDDVGLDKGFLVTFGFALTCDYFSTEFQPQSKFRYLGDQKIDSRDTYVVAFAAKPGVATLSTTMNGPIGPRVHMLLQGIAWIDKTNFQIIRMRMDLLAPHPEIGLLQQTTHLTFTKVQLPDADRDLWLPSVVKVELKLKEAQFGRLVEVDYHNEHHYSDYRRYHVAVKMRTPQ